ncbi:MAG: divergent PAP2 family protein [Lachnospiraceae bacterium]|jgi:acid phosphatase family membrane protein YuiD|nr:divergent PAP2 family protein [Lachnospiraceae bacterium]
MYSLTALLRNPLFAAPAIGWCVAQLLKVLIDMAINGGFHRDRIFGSGGMPSSHSATVCALCTAAAIEYGFGSPEFPITFFLAFIVMYDAMGVRRETGEQAKVLNELQRQLLSMDKVFTNPEELKEFVGHSPLQVLCGAILGIIIAFIVCSVL